jgi:hypothetical protein
MCLKVPNSRTIRLTRSREYCDVSRSTDHKHVTKTILITGESVHLSIPQTKAPIPLQPPAQRGKAKPRPARMSNTAPRRRQHNETGTPGWRPHAPPKCWPSRRYSPQVATDVRTVSLRVLAAIATNLGMVTRLTAIIRTSRRGLVACS